MTGEEHPLTPREVECLEWLGRGRTYAAIASEMSIAVATVAMHVTSARRKLGAATRAQALVIALRRRLIDP